VDSGVRRGRHRALQAEPTMSMTVNDSKVMGRNLRVTTAVEAPLPDAASTRAARAAGELRARIFVYAFSGVYAAVFVAAASTSYLLYLEPRFDLGNVVQAVWASAHGDLLRV